MMITRPVRINVPCSYLSQLKLRCDAYKTRPSEEEKVFVESPFIWSPCSSYLCENQGKNIVKKLDIDAVIRNKVKEDLYLTVYSNINQSRNASKQVNIDTYINDRQKLIDSFISKCETSLTSTTKHSDEDLLPSNNFLGHTSLCSDLSKNTPPNNKDDPNNLPSKEQLDEMMVYFSDQAPALFSSSGWTYQKCSYNIVFENEIIGSKTNSLNSYVFQINLMKNMVRIVLSNPEFDILQMYRGLFDGTVHVRWQVQGVPRYLKPFSLFGLIDESTFNRYIDGYSVFYINSDGLYYRHILTKITPLRRSNPLTSKLFSQISLHRRGLTGDVQKQPVFPALQEGIK